MKSLRFAIALFISSALGLFAFTASAAGIPDEQWHVSTTAWQSLVSTSFHSIAVVDQLPIGDTFSHLWAENLRTPNWTRHQCTSSSDAQCANPQQYSYESILPVCKNGADVDCIDSLTTVDASGKTYSATFKGYNLDKHPNNFTSAPELKGNGSEI